MTTPILALPEVISSQSAKEITINEAIRRFESWTVRVLSKTTTTPPSSPADGDCYIVAPSSTGIWASKDGQLAAFIGTAWVYNVPKEGFSVWVNDLNQQWVHDGSAWILLAGSGAGTVTSVALAMPAELTVSGSPVTSSGTLTVAKATQSANRVYAGPASGAAAAPAFRPAVAADLPVMGASGASHAPGATPDTPSTAGVTRFLREDGTWEGVSSLQGGTVTSVGLSAPAEFSVSGSPVTASGTLTFTKATQSANLVYAGPTSGAAAAPAFRALVAADIPAPYDVGAFLEAAPTASQVVLRHVFARSVTFASGLSPSQGVAGTAATGSTTFSIQKNGTEVGTMVFAASGTTATFTMASQTTFAAGDKLTVVGPATPDSTLAKLAFTLSGTR